MKNENYKNLFSPIKINSLRFPNRIMIAPMGNGSPALCKELANSGASVITLGSYQIDDEWSMLMGYPYPFEKFSGMTINNNPKGEKILRAQLLAIQQSGSYASVELIHAGRYAHNFPKESGKEGKAIGPITETYVHKKGLTINVIGMDETMINHVADNYAKAAVNYIKFGFDMIMLHFAHGWLPWQFLSPTFNKRTDDYGGSFENRIRFPKLIVDKVREAVGPNIPIEMRIGASEFREGGITLEEVIQFIQIVEDKIDIVHISAGLDSEPEVIHHMFGTNLKPHCDKLHFAAEVKKHVHIPVCSVGGFILPEEAEEAIASGKCDLVAIAKGFLVDPEWAVKAYEGRSEDIFPCLRCTVCGGREGYGCVSNPRFNKYEEIPRILPKTTDPKHVVIIGGGPAGTRAAIFASQIGHKVTLFEKNDVLGGQIRNFKDDKYKIDLYLYWQYLIHQIQKYEIDLRLNTEANRENVASCKPDCIIVAVGAHPTKPNIKGIDQPNVIQAIQVYSNPELIKGKVVVIGGGSTGVDTALYISELGHQCDVIELSAVIAPEISKNSDWRYALEWTIKNYHPDLSLRTSTSVKSIEGNSVLIQKDGKEEGLVADTIVLATGFKPNEKLANEFYDICYKTYKIGDCYRVEDWMPQQPKPFTES